MTRLPYFVAHIFDLADDPRFADRVFECTSFGESPIVLAASVAWNAGLEHPVAVQYTKAAFSIHLNPITLHQTYLKLGTLAVAQSKDDAEQGDDEENEE